MAGFFMRQALGPVIGGVVLVGMVGVALTQTTALGIWTMRAPMPTARAEMAAAAVRGKLYAIGGNIGGTAVPHNTEYDPATDMWRQRNPMPVARDHIGIAVVNHKIYTFGGFTHTVHQGASTDVLEYDPATDTWRRRAPLKMPLGGVGAATVAGKISRDCGTRTGRQDGQHAYGLRSGDRQLERGGAAAARARPPRHRGGARRFTRSADG